MTKASLLASESTGGATARDGFGYQDAFVLQSLPLWLSKGAFSHVVSEAVGDVEVCYFGEDGATIRTFIEAKSYTLSWGDFWDEIKQFKKVHETSPKEFPRFMLLCRDFNSNTSPLVTMVSRLRGVGSSYDASSPLLARTREETIAWVMAKGLACDLAEFVLDRVEFVTYADENAHAAFPGEVERYLPSVNLRAKDAAALREKCVALVTRSARGPVTRGEIEGALLGVLGTDTDTWLKTPTKLFLGGSFSSYELGADVDPFNGPARAALTNDDWCSLAKRLAAIGEFIKRSRPRSCVTLSGKQRMTLACLLGYTFSATKGFVLEIDHNSEFYRTDNHAQMPEPFFAVSPTPAAMDAREGVATIAFPTRAGADVDAALGGRLLSASRLNLASERAVDGTLALNKAVAEAKTALSDFRATNRLELTHLFIKAPSHFAMSLGHRLNAVGPIQLYDWVDGRYVATAELD